MNFALGSSSFMLASDRAQLSELPKKVRDQCALPSTISTLWVDLLELVVTSGLVRCGWLFRTDRMGNIGELVSQSGEIGKHDFLQFPSLEKYLAPDAALRLHWLSIKDRLLGVVIIDSPDHEPYALFMLVEPPSASNIKTLDAVVNKMRRSLLEPIAPETQDDAGTSSAAVEERPKFLVDSTSLLADAYPFAVLVIDGAHRVHLQNSSVHRLLSETSVFEIADGRLLLSKTEDAIRLEVALRKILLDGQATHEPVSIAVREGGRIWPYLIRVSKLGENETEKLACIMITDTAPPSKLDIEPLVEFFGLTPAESRLVFEMLSGSSIKEAAAKLKLKVETARGYLKQVFGKTGVHRQVELISLFSSGSLPQS